jgi:HEAT repeat protein
VNDALLDVDRIAIWALWMGLAVAGTMAMVVIAGRLGLFAHERFVRRLTHRYGPLIEQALRGDAEALNALVRSPPRYRLELARLMIFPLVADRSPSRIAATRDVIRAMSLIPLADRWLHSRRWWKRVPALQAFGLLQFADRASQIVAALDDHNADVRNAALDALADLHDPATLQAIVVGLHDTSLQRGRRAAALAAFGSECEGFLLELSGVDSEHRLNYAKALTVCGTARSRPILCEWTADLRKEVRSAAFEALGCIGLDDRAAALAIAALDHGDIQERAMAAAALNRWTGGGDVPPRLARHLGDVWPVAIRAARALRSMGPAGRAALEPYTVRADQAGVLARQMLWEVEAGA